MDQVHVVRHKVLVEGQQIRRVAREMAIARSTVKKYLARAAPVRVEKEPRATPVWEKVRARVEALLMESPRWTGGKQRLTAPRLHRMLVTEGFREARFPEVKTLDTFDFAATDGSRSTPGTSPSSRVANGSNAPTT